MLPVGGWRRPDVLLRHYTDASLEDKQKAAEVLGALANFGPRVVRPEPL